MDIIEVVNKRKTSRGYRPDPVPRETLEEIMTNALRAPSWGNTQPWEFAIVAGKKLEEIKQGFADKAADDPDPDLPFPKRFPQSYLDRLPAGPRPSADRSNKELMTERQLRGSRFYDAPCVIYVYTEREMFEQDGFNNVYAIYDCGIISQNIMLLAANYGLSTTAAAAAVRCPDVVRKVLDIPESKLIVLGIFIGYPDPDHPQFEVYSSREPLENVAHWHGFK